MFEWVCFKRGVFQVINAALALAAKPQSKLAQENMDLFKEQWERQVRVLTDAVDDITSIDDFLAVSGELAPSPSPGLGPGLGGALGTFWSLRALGGVRLAPSPHCAQPGGEVQQGCTLHVPRFGIAG